MTRSADIASINCTSCGAGLDVLGGGRVLVHVCGYCGAELNAQDNYAVLRKFDDLKRPDSPFRIGMTGVIKGVEFTVIGTLGMYESYNGRVWRWCDHQIFSPTHGYAYITVEDHHLTFSRRYRKGTWPGVMSVQKVETSENRPSIHTHDGHFDYYDTSTSEITFIEGEFNWAPSLNERVTTVNAMSDDAMLGFTKTDTEYEIVKTEYLPFRQTCKAFGIDPKRMPNKFHPLIKRRAGTHENFLKYASAGFAILSLVVLMVFAFSQRSLVAQGEEGINRLPVEVAFEITDPNRVTTIRLEADVDNSWGYISAFVLDPDDVPVFEAGRTVERYSGRGSDGAWTEGSGRASIRFRPQIAGTYTLELDLDSADTWTRSGTPLKRVTYTVFQGVAQPIWMVASFALFGFFALFQHGRHFIHNHRRWRGSDWSDED